MIKLLGKYEAYAPPFKYVPALGGEAYVGGIEGRLRWDDDLGNQLRADWDRALKAETIKEWDIPSAHNVKTTYKVRKLQSGWTCTCPARVECWHIRACKQMDLDATCDEVDNVKRSNDYDNPL